MQQPEQAPSPVSSALDAYMASSLAAESSASERPVRVAATDAVDLARLQRELNVADAQSFYLLMTNVLKGYSAS